jgi:hypothetical protein
MITRMLGFSPAKEVAARAKAANRLSGVFMGWIVDYGQRNLGRRNEGRRNEDKGMRTKE